MAIQLEKENNKFNIYEQHFLIDSKNDLQTLESEYTCHQGDKAELPDGSYYMRHSDNYQGDLWELVKSCGGGSSLPSVTSDDNGDILTVVDGAWAKAEPTPISELPEVTIEDNGDFLAVIDGEWNKKDPPYTVSTETEIIIPLQEVILFADSTPDLCVAEIQDSNMDRLSIGDTCIVSYQENAPDRTRSNAQLYTITAKGFDDYLYLGDFDYDNNEPDFSRYPFVILFQPSIKSQKGSAEQGITILYTNHECTINISADRISKTVIVDNDFKTAVEYSLAHTEVVEKDFLPEQTIYSDEFENNYSGVWVENKISFNEDIFESIKDGASCYITFNGIEYCCTVYRGDDNIYFGSIDEIWEDYPFYFEFYPDGTSYLFIPELQDVTFSGYISQDESVYSTVLENAIKEIGVSDSNIFLITATEDESPPTQIVNLSKSEQKSRTVDHIQPYQINKTFDEISLAYDSGKCCLVKILYNSNQNYFSQLVTLTKNDNIKGDNKFFSGEFITAENILIRDDIVNELIFKIYSDNSAELGEKRIFYCLPDPSAGNNGDVLTIVDGEWDKAAPSGGGGGIFWVTLTTDAGTGLISSDKSYNDLAGALANGQMPVGVLEESNVEAVFKDYFSLVGLSKAKDDSVFVAGFRYLSDNLELVAFSASEVLAQQQSPSPDPDSDPVT